MHVASAVLMSELGVLSSSGDGSADVELATLLTLLVWALARCNHVNHVAKTPNAKLPWHMACAAAVTRAWEMLQRGEAAHDAWATDAAARAAYVSVLACLPRAMLLHFQEPFQEARWQECCMRALRRPGPGPSTPAVCSLARLSHALALASRVAPGSLHRRFRTPCCQGPVCSCIRSMCPLSPAAPDEVW